MIFDQEKQRKRAWALAHCEREKQRKHEWYLAHREEVRAAATKWAAAHPDRVKASNLLHGRTVSGLHVEDNLQILTRTENALKWRHVPSFILKESTCAA
mgnify:CR=1 FL=1